MLNDGCRDTAINQNHRKRLLAASPPGVVVVVVAAVGGVVNYKKPLNQKPVTLTKQMASAIPLDAKRHSCMKQMTNYASRFLPVTFLIYHAYECIVIGV